MTPTDPIRDEAVKVPCPWSWEGLPCALDRAHASPHHIVAEEPQFATLARRLALGTAWDAAVAPEESLVEAVVDALMAEETGAGYYRWQYENIVRPAILAALAAKLGSGK